MNDPFTMLYDVWEASFSSSSDIISDPHSSTTKLDARAATEDARSRATSSGGDEHQRDREGALNMEAMHQAELAWARSVWSNVCIMHAVAFLGIAFMLLPSIFYPSLLPCNAMSGMRATGWPVLNSCGAVTCISLMFCGVLHSVMGLHQLALCTSMHSAVRIMIAYANSAHACPMPPILMPHAFASGIGCVLGILLLGITQMHQASSVAWHGDVLHSGFVPGEFYMHHAWGCGIALLVLRHTAFRAVAVSQNLLWTKWLAVQRARLHQD